MAQCMADEGALSMVENDYPTETMNTPASAECAPAACFFATVPPHF